MCLAAAVIGSASAATLSVGPGKAYSAPCAAIGAARDGDVIEITGNTTYSGDACSINRHDLTIRGVNGRPKIDAAGKNAADKGIWVVNGNNLTVDNVEMFGAKVMDGNGAAFRLQGAGFTLRNSFIHDNENGILANANPNSDILIEYTEFGHNGRGDGQTHNLYIGKVRSLTFRYSYSHDANVGHNLKSRAVTNTIVYNRFSSTNPGEHGSTASGQPSYEIDLPNAGTSYVIGNVIQQPAANQNPAIVAYGEEGATNPGQDLYFVNNTVVNDFAGGTFLFVSGKVSTPALIQNNIFVGNGILSTQASAVLKNNYRAFAPDSADRSTASLRRFASALVIGAGTDPGKSAAGVALAPTGQYKDVASGEERPVAGALDLGAFALSDFRSSAKAVTWTECAAEGKDCRFSGTREVRFGGKGLYTSKIVTAATPCTTAVFGDPARGLPKTCSYASVTTAAPAAAPKAAASAWTPCAGEGAICQLSGTNRVRYGTEGKYVTKVLTGPVTCSNATFGDPDHGSLKTCSYRPGR
nr:right-handed parallel beta-helix repeat-containing protein [Massilia sp. PDC64]